MDPRRLGTPLAKRVWYSDVMQAADAIEPMSLAQIPEIPASLVIRGVSFAPALFCAPMAGHSHSAFRRLVSDFGGYGALFTEMLCGRWLLHENLRRSPATRRRTQEGRVIYQIMVRKEDEVAPILDRISVLEPDGIDLNCACPAPLVRATGAGAALFEDRERLERVLDACRRCHSGPLSVKIRLGITEAGWRERMADRLRLFESTGVDLVILHPRFVKEKLRGRARHELSSEIASLTRLPVVACGDLGTSDASRSATRSLPGLAGLMVGRMALVQPWLFASWTGSAPVVDHLEVWTRLCRYVLEDFPPEKALYRIKAFTRYFSRNFFFGHTLGAIATGSSDLSSLLDRGTAFLAARPALSACPDVLGID
jgi:tRNA-dihydrouridine synthase B